MSFLSKFWDFSQKAVDFITEPVGRAFNNISGQTINNRFNAEEAQKQREYETQMSNTAIQRQVEDAKSAGINPAMMFSNSSSSGATTPTGSSANSAVSGGATGVASLLNSAANLARTFNYDNRKNNDVNLRQVLNTVATASKLFK